MNPRSHSSHSVLSDVTKLLGVLVFSFTLLFTQEFTYAATSPIVVIGDGVDATSTIISPGSAATSTNSFTLQRGSDLAGQNWVTTTTPSNGWYSVTYGNGLFVAVANGGGISGNRIMTSPDGVNWTLRSTPTDAGWFSIAYGNGMFVVVANNGTNRVMTSPDGINWTLRSASAANAWFSVTYGNGLFVAVAGSGTGNRVMTSPDGITWTSRTSAADNTWTNVTYGNGLFVAVAGSGTGNRVMTSPDGITWTSRTSAVDNFWYSVTYGNGLFVAVSSTGSGNQVMTSPNGITWTTRSTPVVNSWYNVTYGNGLFVAVANGGCSSNCMMTSLDGITWTAKAIATPLESTVYAAGAFVSVSNTAGAMISGSVVTVNQVNISLNSTPENDGVVWSTSTSAADNAWQSVTYGNGLFVAVACGVSSTTCNSTSGSRIMTSPDGINWTLRGAADGNFWESVTYGNGLFVAVGVESSGTEGYAMTSSDGITWSAPAMISNNYLKEVVYGNGLFVAVALNGPGNRILTSPDGITWTIRGTPTFSWTSLAYGNGMFVAVASAATGARAMTSPDGITWTVRTVPADINWESVTYGNGLFVAVASSGTGNRVMTSPDGITWTSRTSAADNTWTNVTYGNGLFVAVACGVSSTSCNSTSGSRIMTSPDGITWTLRTSIVDNQWTSVTYGNGKFIAVSNSGTGNRIVTSSSFSDGTGVVPGLINDGSVWATSTTPANNAWYAITYGNGLFVAVACGVATSSACENSTVGSRIMTSPDGVTWTLRSTPANNVLRGVTYGNGMFVAVGGDATILSSSDGITWTSRTNPTTNPMISVTYGNGLFVAVAIAGTSGNRVITSPDGITWTARTSAADNQWNSVAYGNGLFVAVASTGSNDAVMTSPDGITWTSRAVPVDSHSSIAYGNGIFVITRVNSSVMTSPDGITWTTRAVPSGYWYSIAYGNGLFVATAASGGGNSVISSPDGINWKVQVASTSNDWYGVAYGDGKFVAVSWNGSGNRAMVTKSKSGKVDFQINNDGTKRWMVGKGEPANQWLSVAYGAGLFVAVSTSGTGNRVMTSPDGINWTARTSPANNAWEHVIYAGGQFVAVSWSPGAVMTSPDGLVWTLRSTPNVAYSVTYGNNTYVAVGASGAVMTSPDGITWTTRTAASSTNWRSVTYGNGLFVAISQSSANIMTSPDGISWTLRTAPVSSGWFNIVYGNGLFVAFATTGGQIISSPDGINWTLRTNPASHGWINATYANNTFVAVANSGTGDRVMTSVDGIAWTIRSSAADSGWRGIAYGNGRFVAVADTGTNRTMLSSADFNSSTYSGVASVEVTDSTGTIVYGSVVNPITEIVQISLTTPIVVSSLSTLYRIRITPKPHTDQPSTVSEAYALNPKVISVSTSAIVEGYDSAGGTFIIDNNPSQDVTDPFRWKRVKSALNGNMTDIAYGNGIFVGVAETGTSSRIMTSPDGVIWTERNAPQVGVWQGVTYGNGMFVAVACGVNSTGCSDTTSGAAYSYDGITWTLGGATPSARWSSVTYGNGRFVAVAYNNMVAMVSYDGINWSSKSTGNNGAWIDIAYGNGIFVATADTNVTNRVMTSYDGETWTSPTLSSTLNAVAWQSITYGNGLFVAAGSSTNTFPIMSSPDGINWSLQSTPPGAIGASPAGIAYGGGYFIAVSGRGVNRIIASIDGINWQAVPANGASTDSWSGVAYGKGRFVAVARSGTFDNVSVTKLVTAIPSSNKATLSLPIIFSSEARRVLLLQSTSPISVRPTDGVSYATSSVLGSSVVGCSFNVTTFGANVCNVTSSTYNGQSYYFKIFTADTNLNYSEGVEISNQPVTIGATTILGDGADTSNVTLAPGSTATTSNAFTLQTDTGTDSIQSITVELGTGNATSTSLIEITNDAGTIVHGSVSNPETDSVRIPISTPLTANTSLTQYKVRITPKSHTDASLIPSGNYMITSYVSAFESTRLGRVVEDEGGTILTIDNSPPVITEGDLWSIKTAAASNSWASVTYGNGLFVAVASSGTGNRVMTSPDGITWTLRTSAADNTWNSVTYGNGLFVAVAQSGTGNRVMTSPDGITWTARTSAEDNAWNSVTYGNGLFVAVACGINSTGCNATAGNRVMTSPDGITWTARTGVVGVNAFWYSVTYGNGMFVATGQYTIGNRIMTSPDGITWTARSGATDNHWYSVVYANGQFVAVGTPYVSNATARVMTSPDGINWTLRTSPSDALWMSVTYGNGLFVAVSCGDGIICNTTATKRIMTSPDGITWTLKTSPADINWRSITYGNGTFVAVSTTGTANRVMTSGLITNATSSQISLTYTLPDDTLSSAIILRSTSPVTDTPLDGQTYATSTVIGASTVVCSHQAMASTTYTCNSTGLTDGTPYYYKLYTMDVYGNWSLGSEPVPNPVLPGSANVIVNMGTSLSNITVGPGAGSVDLTTFTLQTSFGSDSIQSITIKLPAGTATSTNEVRITDNFGSSLGSVFNPTSDVITIPVSGLSVSTTQTQYKVAAIIKNHASMPTVSQLYALSAEIKWIDTTAARVNLSHFTGRTVYVDNMPPDEVVSSIAEAWVARTVPANNASWSSVAFGNNRFVAVACGIGATSTCNGTAGDRVMYSLDNGLNWATSSDSTDNQWRYVTYGNGLFAAVAINCATNNCVMTSPDGITWTTRTTPSGGPTSWQSVAYGNNIFVAVGYCGSTPANCTMTSTDGITWTLGTNPSSTITSFNSIIFANGKFVAVTNYGGGGVSGSMISTDGLNWTQYSISNGFWRPSAYGNGLYATVSDGGGAYIITSPDGITWTTRTNPGGTSQWQSVTYGSGKFVAVGSTATNARAMTSVDGITWATSTTPSSVNNYFRDVRFGNNSFVAVSWDGTANNRAMVSNMLPYTYTGNASAATYYKTGTSTDLSSILVLRSISPITERPVDGQSYATGTSIGAAVVDCSTTVTLNTVSVCNSSSLGNGTPHYFRIFTADSYGNWSVGIEPLNGSVSPGLTSATVVLDSGDDPANIELAPGSSATTTNTFALQTTSGTDVIESVTIGLGQGVATSTSLIEITNDAGNTVYGSVANPTTENVYIPLTNTTLTATTLRTRYRVRVTPKSFASITSGKKFLFSCKVTEVNTTSAAFSGSDAAPMVVIDREPPLVPQTASTLTDISSDRMIVRYMNSTTTDIAQVLTLRSTSPVVDVPTDGVSYSVGNVIGASTVACISSSITLGENSCTFQNTSRGVRYYFSIFNRDLQGNYSPARAAGSALFPAFSPRQLLIEFESLNGGSATTTGGTNQGGGTGGQTGTTTNATTTTSTSTPGQGGGGGDIGFFGSFKSLFAHLGNTGGLFATLLNLTGTNPVYASEAKVTETNPVTCRVSLAGVCIVKNLPFMEKVR